MFDPIDILISGHQEHNKQNINSVLTHMIPISDHTLENGIQMFLWSNTTPTTSSSIERDVAVQYNESLLVLCSCDKESALLSIIYTRLLEMPWARSKTSCPPRDVWIKLQALQSAYNRDLISISYTTIKNTEFGKNVELYDGYNPDLLIWKRKYFM